MCSVAFIFRKAKRKICVNQCHQWFPDQTRSEPISTPNRTHPSPAPLSKSYPSSLSPREFSRSEPPKNRSKRAHFSVLFGIVFALGPGNGGIVARHRCSGWFSAGARILVRSMKGGLSSVGRALSGATFRLAAAVSQRGPLLHLRRPSPK